MWYNTPISKTLGIQYPILQGPFGGGLSSIPLLKTVSDMGGLGGYGCYTMPAAEIHTVLDNIRQATAQPFNINLWVNDVDAVSEISDAVYERTRVLFQPFYDEVGVAVPDKPKAPVSKFAEQVEVLIETRVPVFSFVFGIPSEDILERCRRAGIKTAGAATTLDEAIALENAGVDVIVASGFEGGGHRPSFLASQESSLVGTFALVQQICDKVKTPVVAAGGIANTRGIAAAFALGAQGVQIGTAFLACEESNALPIHREMLFSDQARYTVLTKAFTGRFGRGIRSKISEALRGEDVLPFPSQTQFVSPLRKAALEQAKNDMVLFWGGQIAPLLKHRKAAALMEEIIREANTLIRK